MGYNLALHNPKTRDNVASLLRSGQNFGLNALFVIGGFVAEKYKGNIHKFDHQMNTQDGISRINLQYFESMHDFLKHLPAQTTLVIVEMREDAQELSDYDHPTNATYLFGRETVGITEDLFKEIAQYYESLNSGIPEAFKTTHRKTSRCESIKIPTKESLNVSVCGSIVMYDRFTKARKATKLPNVAL